MNAESQVIIHKKRLAPSGQTLSATELSLEGKAIAAVLESMQRRIVALEAHNRREDHA